MVDQRKIKILLVEDNPADARLTQEVFKECKINNQIDIVDDGEKAIEYLHKNGEYKTASTPDLILLDLNLPKKMGDRF